MVVVGGGISAHIEMVSLAVQAAMSQVVWRHVRTRLYSHCLFDSKLLFYSIEKQVHPGSSKYSYSVEFCRLFKERLLKVFFINTSCVNS